MDINIFEKIYSSLTKGNENIRASLAKIKTILADETRESNEMLKIYQKYVTNNEKITKEELDQANKQFSDLLKGLGASEIISREQLSELSRAPIGKPIWDFGVDVVSGNILTLLLASLKPGGAVACSGLVGGPSFESSIYPFILRGNALLGVDSVEISIEKKLEVWENFATDWKLDLSSLVKEVKLEGLEDEISKILTGGQVGRVVVDLN